MEIVKESPQRKSAGRPPKYPFESMKIGDCLKIKNATPGQYNTVSSCAHHYKRRNKLNWTFSIRLHNNTISLYRTK